MDLSIIIVNYNTRNLTLNCIQSIKDSQLNYDYEILLVDNNSTDGSADAIKTSFSDVILIENMENVGFSKANNQAIKISAGRYVLLLNSDTIVNKNTLSDTILYMEKNPMVGACGCEVLLPDGSLDKACHRGFPTPQASFYYLTGISKCFPNNPSLNGYHLNYLDMKKVHEIDCLVGAFMMVRKEAIYQVGLLDEIFFMYGEDIDWCFRLKKAGWKIIYNPDVSIIHHKGASSKKKPLKIIYEFHRAMFIFHRKHFKNKYPIVINWIVYLGIGIRLSSSVLFNELKKIRSK